MTKIVEEFKNLTKLASSNKSLVKYLAYKYFKETDKNIFIVQVDFIRLSEFLESI